MKAKVLSLEQMRMVTGRLAEPSRMMAMISPTTAVKESDLFALSDEDFDLISGTLGIQRRHYRGKLGRVKTKKSERGLPLCAEVVEAVRNLNHNGPFLFLEPDGSGEASLSTRRERNSREWRKCLDSRTSLGAASAVHRRAPCTTARCHSRRSRESWALATRT